MILSTWKHEWQMVKTIDNGFVRYVVDVGGHGELFA